MKAKKNAPVSGNRTRGRAIKSNFSLMDFGVDVNRGDECAGCKSISR